LKFTYFQVLIHFSIKRKRSFDSFGKQQPRHEVNDHR